ncbi:MAG: GNAT family N-acetyltransferase [Alphaproteobacteria bacterium]
MNDFKLVPLEALVHDEALFNNYLEMLKSVHEIYQVEDLNVQGEIDLGDDYQWEEQVLFKESAFWFSHGKPDVEGFIRWVNSKDGYWSRYESDTPDTFKLFSDVLIDNNSEDVLGRSQLFCGLDQGRWVAMGFDCIHPDHRGQGLGRVILAHRLNRARQAGMDEIKLNAKTQNLGSIKRMDKLEQAGLSLRHKFAGHSSWRREIAWYSLPENLEQAYDILTGQSSEKIDPPAIQGFE